MDGSLVSRETYWLQVPMACHHRPMYANDPLTGLTVISSFRDWARQRLRDGDVKVATVHLPGFADYNARLGHGEGDRLLRRTAQSLQGLLDDATSLCARDGGKFLVMMMADEPDPDLSVLGDVEVNVTWYRIESMEELDALLPPSHAGDLPPGSGGHDYIA